MAFAWAACPYTAFALESNTNDALVALLLVAAMLVLASPAKRGIALGLAGMTKFAPLVLAPLFATYVPPGDHDKDTTPVTRAVALFGIAFLATIAVVIAWAAIDPGPKTFWGQTISLQADRDSPFSIWGQTDLGPLHGVVEVLAGALALFVAFRPRRKDPYVVAALGAAVLIAFQLTVSHWFYLYIPWFLALLVIPLAAGVARPRDRASGSARPSQPALGR